MSNDDVLPIVLASFSTDPETPNAGAKVTLYFSFENETDSDITCQEIAIDLNPGDTPENLCTDEAVQDSVITPSHPGSWNFQHAYDKTKKVHYLSLTPHNSHHPVLGPGDRLDVAITVQVSAGLRSDDLTETVVTVTEHIGDARPSQDIPLAKSPAGTVFDSFRADPPDKVLVQQGEHLQLSWSCDPIGFERGSTAGKPYYTLTIDYDQLAEPLDITDLNNDGAGAYTGPDEDHSLALSHTTLFALTLTLWDKTHQQKLTHTLTTLVSVQPTDVDLGNLSIDRTASILTDPQLITTIGNHVATTDGLLLCTVRGSNSGIVVKVTAPDAEEVDYAINTGTVDPYDDPTQFTGCRMLLPIARDSTVSISSPESDGTYRTAWYPLGIGTLAKQ
ncbi:hypothetical protein [Nocardia sp. alder85J]|uniref:hypothetical protein n=1 Tax=Nocardia sp. alder85J TaxID=2862949 RepID=UPI001CD4154C|nr:hypothetical protein [Nocardia sp. alder85J]MCX4096662.1 hypothetical protein [Nocardia sp. alder85J]